MLIIFGSLPGSGKTSRIRGALTRGALIRGALARVAEHRQRVESRGSDIPGLAPQRWGAVRQRDHAARTRPRLVIDTAGQTIAASTAALPAELA